ncbi:hypothetical protein NQ317_016498 [Molorchus minor]|uniref:Uncharacterized protein n=1 Tax=Molorchus minor TaxID=1323400 RepID=A0ABQ9JT75_9CUCU|nr:hypothetical protein NQ317_016498 [Molorchus minor]
MRKLEKKLEDYSSSSNSENTEDGTSGETSEAEIENNILGDDPATVSQFGPNISEDLARRWRKYLSEGLDKEVKSTLLGKMLIPENCRPLTGPKLNPEIQFMLSPTEIKKEGFLLELQASLGKGLASLGSTITSLLEKQTEEGETILGNLVEAGKILCHVHYTVSNHRKFVLYPHLNAKTQKIAMAQKPDMFLFGEDFSEKCKAAKTLEGTAKDLQASTSKNFKSRASKVRWKSHAYPRQGRGGNTANSHPRSSYRPNHRSKNEYSRQKRNNRNS